jgi:predicted nucleic acid-binding protein
LLIDTSALLRTLQPFHPQLEVVSSSLKELTARGVELQIVPQNLYELWAVATRPVAQNGLGLSADEAASELSRLKDIFVFLPDSSAIYDVWEDLVVRHRVSGKPAHDARLVAAMIVHGVPDILTLDRTGFSHYAGIEVVHPADVVAG